MEDEYNHRSDELLKITVDTNPPFNICWRVRQGARVRKNQILGYIATSNDTSQNVYSPCNGRIVELRFSSGLVSDLKIDALNKTCVCLLRPEACQHPALVESLCVECGADALTSSSSVSSESVYTSTLGFVASGRDFLTTHDFARRLEVEKIVTLLKCRKLPLVLDLDNTLLHAYPIIPPEDTEAFFKKQNVEFRVCTLHDPALYVTLSKEEAMRIQHYKSYPVYQRTDLQNESIYYAHPHYLKEYDAEIFKRWESWVLELDTNDFPPNAMRCVSQSELAEKPYICYYKLRPGVFEFLRKASRLFELYLFTAGTMMHAISSLMLLDPARLWFGDRVFTREDLPMKECGALGLKTIQRIFPGELTRHTLVTIVDDCDSVWAPGTNILKAYAYNWWPDPTFHPLLLLYYRRTLKSAGSHTHVPVGILDSDSYTRLRSISVGLLNFLPSILELCRSPRVVFNLAKYQPDFTTSTNFGLTDTFSQNNTAESTKNEGGKPHRDSEEVMEKGLAPKKIKTESSDFDLLHLINPARSQKIVQLERTMLESGLVASPEKPVYENVTEIKKFNILSRHDARFGLPEGNETINETNARVLMTATKDWKPPTILKDTDRQLPYIFEILKAMHKLFFIQLDKKCPSGYNNVDITDLPNVKDILDSMRQQILKGVIIKCTGIREANIPSFQSTDLGRAVGMMGGEIIGQNSKQHATHLLVGRDTAYYSFIKKQGQSLYTPHVMWIEAALFTFCRADESLFDPEKCEKDFRVFWDALENISIKSIDIEARASDDGEYFRDLDDLEVLLFGDVECHEDRID